MKSRLLATLLSVVVLPFALRAAATNQPGSDPGPIPARQLEPGPLVPWAGFAGGNDRCFQAVCAPNGINWTDAEALAVAHGGHLATITSAAENNFVFHLIDEPKYWQNSEFADSPFSMGPWLGGLKSPASTQNGAGWQWLNGEGPLRYTAWATGQPGSGGGGDRVHFTGNGANNRQPTWDAIGQGQATRGFVVEFPAGASDGSGGQPDFAGPTVYPVPTPTTTRLITVQTALLVVDGALQNAETADQGGYLEKSRTAMNKALTAIAVDLATARAETDPAPSPTGPADLLTALQSRITDLLRKDRDYLRIAPDLTRVLNELQTAASQLGQLPAGDEGGARNRLVANLEQVVANLATGIDVAKTQAVPSVAVPVPGPNGLPTDLVILSAIFGADTRRKDITPLVAEMVRPQNIAVVVSNVTLKIDPAPNVVKDIVIKYTYRGVPNAVILREGDILSHQLLVANATRPAG